MKQSLIRLALAMGTAAGMVFVPAAVSRAAVPPPASAQPNAVYWHYVGQYPTQQAAYQALIAVCQANSGFVGHLIEQTFSNGVVGYVAWYRLANGFTVNSAANTCSPLP